MKTYYLTLSQTFPATHPRHGQPTYFKEKIANAIYHMRHQEVFEPGEPSDGDEKYHTIRGNYDRWYKIFEQIYAGEACLSLRVWSGKPYRSKMIEIARLTKDDGIGIQKLEFVPCCGIIGATVVIEGEDKFMSKITLAANDGMTHDDWLDWFKSYDLSKPLAIIHFTNFRY